MQVGLELAGHVQEYVATWAELQYHDKKHFKTTVEINEWLKNEPLYDCKTKTWTGLADKSIKLEKDLYDPLQKVLVAILKGLTKIPSEDFEETASFTADDTTDSLNQSTASRAADSDDNAPDSNHSATERASDSISGSDDFEGSDYIPNSNHGKKQSVDSTVVGPSGTREVRISDKLHFMHVEAFDNCDQYTSPDIVFRATGSSFEVPSGTRPADLLTALGYTNITSFIEVKLSEEDFQALLEQIGVYVR